MSSLIVGLTLLLAAPPAHDPTRRVHDFAGVLPVATVQSLEALARDVETKTTAQMAIVTVNSLEGETVEEYANELFNAWGIGQRETNNGVLILVSPGARSMRIEVGRGLNELLTAALCGEIRDEYMLPAFKAEKFDQGIENGAREIASILEKYPDAARGIPGSAPWFVRTARRDAQTALYALATVVVGVFVVGALAVRRRAYSPIVFYFLLVALAIVAAVAAVLIYRVPRGGDLFWWLGGTGAAGAAAHGTNVRRYRRFGPHSCAKCGTRLELLDEQADDAKLTEVQKLEEKLGSVDYDVWFCPACLQSETEPYIAFLTSYAKCPKCKAQAFKEGPRQVIQSATTFSSGLAKIDGYCVACKYASSRTVTLPRLADSSSSGSGYSSGGFSGGGGGGGGSSFGGGSSGGGGASGRW